MSPLEHWAFILNNAKWLGMDEIRVLLPEKVFIEAAGILEMIAQTPEQKLLYDARRKFELDNKA